MPIYTVTAVSRYAVAVATGRTRDRGTIRVTRQARASLRDAMPGAGAGAVCCCKQAVCGSTARLALLM